MRKIFIFPATNNQFI